MKTLRRLLIAVVAVALVGLGTLAGSSWYYGGRDGMGCARCHEIRPQVDAWAHSSHRNVACKECHGSSFSTELRMHVKNLQRVWLHSRGQTPEQIHVRHPMSSAWSSTAAAATSRSTRTGRAGRTAHPTRRSSSTPSTTRTSS